MDQDGDLAEGLGQGAVDALSVGDIVRMHAAGATGQRGEDPWSLALVQRALVWNPDRIGRLLDSLLAGYPIGTILLCRSEAPTPALEKTEEGRHLVEDSRAWQVLDGQQRLHALATLFSACGGRWEFYLHASAPRYSDLQWDRKDPRLHHFITWSTERDERSFNGPPRSGSDRGHWISLRRLGACLLRDGPPRLDAREPAALQDWLRGVDADFHALLPGREETICDHAGALLAAWVKRCIPIQRIHLRDLDDILQVFARINLSGVRTSGADLFFAGVKRYWHAAEERLDGMCRDSIILDRMSALRLIARRESLAAEDGDVVPLALGRLKGSRGPVLVERMEAASRDASMRARLTDAGRVLSGPTGLAGALEHIDACLLDHVLAWFIDSRRPPADLVPAMGYLVWGTAFRLRSVFDDAFDRLAMGEATTAAMKHEPFPLDAILSKVRDEWPELRRGALEVQPPADDVTRRRMVQSSGSLFLSLVQELPWRPDDRLVDWDHVMAQSLESRLKWKGPDGTWRRQYHEEARRLVGRAGNYCALDHRINRAAQADSPIVKLPLLRTDGYGLPTWPAQLHIAADEQEWLLEGWRLVEEDRVAEAEPLLRRFVDSREDRAWAMVAARFPEVAQFETRMGSARSEPR